MKQQITFSKVILLLVMATYYVGLFLGAFVVWRILLTYPDYSVQALIALLSYIGAPTGVSIAFYSWKAKNENVLKIERSIIEESEEESEEETGGY